MAAVYTAKTRQAGVIKAGERAGGSAGFVSGVATSHIPFAAMVDVVGHSASTNIPMELLDHILSFLSWPFDLHPLLLVNKRLSSLAERALYSNLGELPAQRSVRLLLSLTNAPVARRELVKALRVNFTENRVLFALEVLIAKVLCLLPRLHTLIVEVSVRESKHRALAWIFPRDAPFRLRSFETSIRCVLLCLRLSFFFLVQ